MIERSQVVGPRMTKTEAPSTACNPPEPLLETEAESASIAIVGMAGCFPGAPDVVTFWQKLCAGEECLVRFSAAELLRGGIPPTSVADSLYVPTNGLLAGVELFDAGFFGMSPREASITDPQHRIFLELAWHAFENSGHDPAHFNGAVGVYAGCGTSSYLLQNLLPSRTELADCGELRLRMATGQEYLTTRVSYKLNLTGPSVSINTACSTSLVAVHMACDALRNFECDMALGGGISVQVPQVKGYRYEPGGILSPDGHCRAFDAAAQGTVSGNGGAIVVLRRLGDAVADGDTIYAVIRGSAINNDGAEKAGYTAPSVRGQAQVIIEAHDMAGVDPETIEYVETHGTGTPLGDPIEFAALTRAFRRKTQLRQFCAIGAVKSNVGHLDEAAGVTGLIKAVLSLHHRRIPPSLHFRTPNPEMDYDASPFFVNTALQEWLPPAGGRRRAGVSSFGIGGTNAHLVLEEAPPAAPQPSMRPVQLLPLSATSAEGLRQKRAVLAGWLANPDAPALADVAHTLQVGRRAFGWRGAVVAADPAEATATLRSINPPGDMAPRDQPPVLFMFSGQGSQHPGMAADLYTHEPVFREALDTCADLIQPLLGLDLRDVLYGGHSGSGSTLQRTEFTQPALFAVGYSLARLWQHWGLRPVALIGHSLGEYVAACIAGVLDLGPAVALVARRGQVMQTGPAGAMLAISLSEASLRPLLQEERLELAAVNAPDRCVIGGPISAVRRLADALEAQGIEAQLLHTSHAFHTTAMEPVLEAFSAELGRVRFRLPEIPLISNVTGEWMRPQEATEPRYYLRQARQTVRFADGLACVLRRHPDAVLLEVGPGQALTQMARRCVPTGTPCLPSLPPPQGGGTPHRVMLASLGALWTRGISPDWANFAEPGRRRVALPFTPLERKRHWIEPRAPVTTATSAAVAAPEDAWCYRSVWHRTPPPEPRTPKGHWVLLSEDGQDRVVAEALQGADCRVTRVRPDADLTRALPDEQCEVVWLASHGRSLGWRAEDWVYGLTTLFQAMDGRSSFSSVSILASGVAAVAPGETAGLDAEKGSLAGFVRAIAGEYPETSVRLFDFPTGALEDMVAVNAVLSLCQEPETAAFSAWRADGYWRAALERLPAPALPTLPLRMGATYLITGGLGGIGLTIAEYLAREWRAQLVLVGRTAVPPEAEWPRMLADPAVPSARRHVLARLQSLRADGVAILVEAADVSQERQLSEAIARARARFGRLQGVVHAAGIADGAVVARQRREAIEAVLAPKIAGTRLLVALLKQERLDFLILCSALSAAIGAPGQAAYSAANSYLDNFALSGAAPWPVVSIAWDAWRDVGMAARTSSSGSPRRDFDHPLIEGWQARDDGSVIFDARLSPVRDWVLTEHRIGEQALLPGTAYLELAYVAACHVLGRTAIALEDVLFLQPLWLQTDEEVRLEVAVVPQGERYGFTISTRVGDGNSLNVHAEGQIAATDPITELFPTETVSPQQPGKALRRSLGQFGPRWQCLTRLYGSARDHADISLPATFASTDAGYRLHPALLDVATGFAVLDRPGSFDLLPFAYRRIAVYERLPAHFSSRVTQYHAGPHGLHLDLTLTDPEGRVVALIEGYELRRSPQLADRGENFCLAVGMPGQFDSLGLQSCAREAPRAGEVEIEVFAAGLNFKEVLFASGLLPEVEASGFRLGLECAGRITRMAPQAGPHRPGDAVLAYGAGCLQRFAIVPAAQAVPLPAGLSFAEGAGLPTAFVTAYYALVHQARLQPGETVLIHAAAGGVGLASVQVAHSLGAIVLCTAGKPEKRVFLEKLGVVGVFDSRSTDFVEDVRRHTVGRGVDVVLNSLGGDLLRAGLSCLAPYGRFLELGVRDIHAGHPLDLSYFAKAISFHAISVGPGMPGFAGLFREVMDKIRTGAFTPLPHKVFPMASSCNAFTYMARARHIGKVVIALRSDAQRRPEPGVERDGLSSAQGLAVMRRALASGEPQVIVSRRDPATLVALQRRTASPPDGTPLSGGAPRPSLPTPFVASVGAAETGMAAIWQRILGLASIGTDDDFFALGGDSLIGTQLIAQTNRALGSRLTLRQLFEHSTIAGLASCLTASEALVAGIPRAPAQPDYPLTHAQRRLWILARNTIASIAYNMTYGLNLDGALDVAALGRAFGFVIARHESLRTAFVVSDGEPRARIYPGSDFDLPVLDLRHRLDPVAAARREIAVEAREPLPLDRPPLLRARLLRLTSDRHILLVTVHHIVADGLSLNVLMRELHDGYSAYASGRRPVLPPLAVQGKDVAVWEQERLADGGLQSDREYWLEKLAGDLPGLDLPTDRVRPPEQQFSGSNVVLQLRDGHAALHRCCRDQGVSLFMMLVAVLKVLLHKLTGAEEILVGSPVAGRDRAELEGQIGHYLNTVVLRDTVRRGETFTALLERVRVTVAEALAHQSYPFDLIIEELAVRPPSGHQALFDVQINLMPAETPTLRLGELAVEAVATDSETTIFDLNFMFSDSPDALTLEIGYATALFEASTVKCWGDALLAVLTGISEDPRRTVRSLCALIEGGEAADEKAGFLAAALQLDDEF
jgi:acyl transferase domain-containing protein